MKTPQTILLLFLTLAGALTVSAGDFSLIIKGTTAKNNLRVGKKENLSFRKETLKQTTTLTFRTNRGFIEGKATLKVKKADEFTFAVAGEFLRNDDAKKQYYDWIEIEKLKVNGQALIGEGSKENPKPLNVSKAKILPQKIKVRSSSEMVIELKFRETPKVDADALSEKMGTSDFKKSQKAKKDRQEKRRQERKKQKAADEGEESAQDAKDAKDSKAPAAKSDGNAAPDGPADNE